MAPETEPPAPSDEGRAPRPLAPAGGFRTGTTPPATRRRDSRAPLATRKLLPLDRGTDLPSPCRRYVLEEAVEVTSRPIERRHKLAERERARRICCSLLLQVVFLFGSCAAARRRFAQSTTGRRRPNRRESAVDLAPIRQRVSAAIFLHRKTATRSLANLGAHSRAREKKHRGILARRAAEGPPGAHGAQRDGGKVNPRSVSTWGREGIRARKVTEELDELPKPSPLGRDLLGRRVRRGDVGRPSSPLVPRRAPR